MSFVVWAYYQDTGTWKKLKVIIFKKNVPVLDEPLEFYHRSIRQRFSESKNKNGCSNFYT